MGAVTEKGGLGKALFDNAFEAKQEGLAQGYLTHSVWDSLVFSKIQQQLGGRVRLMITGSAPISDKVMDFLRICFACPVIEGYGQTESTAAVSTTLQGDTACGNVGVPLGSCELKLVDVPEMDYLSTDNPPRGELCFRGPCASQGYYKDPQKTAELIDKFGWSHSGDIGTFLPNGNLKIIDRKKNIFKLSQGEYVAPEKLENIFVQSKWVMQCFIYGDSLKSSVVGIVVPDPEAMKEWAKTNARTEDLATLCKDPAIIKFIQDDMVTVGKANQLKGFEFPSKISLSHEPFSMENDILTPTFKIKRPQAKALFQPLIDKMYEGAD
jgi:long-chain acyl-CoA synthetase